MNLTLHYEDLVSLDQFGFLAVTGRDAVKFLQGYTTCDLEKLKENQVMRGAICNIKGRMVSNFLVIRITDGLLLRLDRALVTVTETFLKKYIVFSKAELADLSDTTFCYGAPGDSLTADQSDVPQEIYGLTHTADGHLLKVDTDRFEYWTTIRPEAGGSKVVWQTQELNSGVVWVNSKTSEEYIPQMFDLHNQLGISFDKGCYLGQEIVARMQYRGELKNRLHLCELPADAPVDSDVGSRILSGDGKKLGEIVARSENLCALVLKAGEPTYTLEDGTGIKVQEVSPAP